MTTVFIPRDSAALSVGADDVAKAFVEATKGQDVTIVRTGSRGMLWMEPLVEVETPAGRVGYANVEASDVDRLIKNGLLEGKNSIGVVAELPWLSKQQRITFARVGVINPVSVADYEAHGGFKGLRNALATSSEALIQLLNLDFVAVVAQASQQALSGRQYLMHLPIRNTSAVTLMKVTLELSQTAC
jgi:formate dehydrogenase iron-sulfur subunit